MILGNTVNQTVTLNGASSTVAVPADENPQVGFGVVGTGKIWSSTPGPNVAISPLGTAVATATSSMLVDWRTAGLFTVTAYGGGWTITFTDASSVLTPSVGQVIRIKITHAASSSITWPSTITWISASSAAPTTTTNDCIVELTCLTTGSSPTFLGTIAAQVS